MVVIGIRGKKQYKYGCLLKNSLWFQSSISQAPCFLKSYGVWMGKGLQDQVQDCTWCTQLGMLF